VTGDVLAGAVTAEVAGEERAGDDADGRVTGVLADGLPAGFGRLPTAGARRATGDE
jgi:hypothetical protein